MLAPLGKRARTELTIEVSADEQPPDSLHQLVLGYLDKQRAVIARGDVALRQGEEPIHRTRVAIRRYRSVLRVFADEFGSEQAVGLDAELSWFASLLGPVRDLHVLDRHLKRALAALPEGVDVAAATSVIDGRLELDEAAARGTLKVALSSARYDRLLLTLDDWHTNPPLVREDR